MKSSFKPVALGVLASLICVQSAQAFDLGSLNPLRRTTRTARPGDVLVQRGNLNRQAPRPQASVPTQNSPTNTQTAKVSRTNSRPASQNLNNQIASVLSQNAIQIGQTAVDLKTLRALYSLHQGQAFWTNDAGLTDMGETLQQQLNEMSEAQGLSTDYYLTADVMVRIGADDAQSLAELDVLLTQGYMLFLKDMTTGRINPRDPSQGLQDIEMKKNSSPKLELLNSLTTSPSTLVSGMYDLIPKAVGYTALVNTIIKLQIGRDQGGWAEFSADRPVLKPGDTHANIIAIRQRLSDMGFLPTRVRNDRGTIYDAAMVQAVTKYQELNFLGADGIIGNGTYKSMDMSINKAINQTRANMEKWRLLPRTFPSRYLFVDMGRQELDIIENNQLVDRMKVVVGKDLHGTPTMTDQVTQLTLAPYWYPPKSIIVNEMIPKLLSDSNYASRVRLKILNGDSEVNPASVNWSQYSLSNPPPYLFRQNSGPDNSLGLVKFELTNDHAIYMHDTDNHSVFSENIRYLSHGCIRLERPFDLADYLMRDKGVSGEEMKYNAEDPSVHAKKVAVTPTTVYIFGTTMVNYPGGLVTFGADIYGQDDRIIKALDQMALPSTAALAVAPAAK